MMKKDKQNDEANGCSGSRGRLGRPESGSSRYSLLRILELGAAALLVLLIAQPVALQPAALANDDDHIWCVSRETVPGNVGYLRAFYSAVFLGDYSSTTGYENAFRDFLRDQYGSDSEFLLDESCYSNSTPQERFTPV